MKEEIRHKVTSDKVNPINIKVRSVSDLKIGMRMGKDIMSKGGQRPLVKSGECLTKLHIDQLNKWNTRTNKKNPTGQVDRANKGGYDINGVALGERERPEIESNPLLSNAFRGINTSTFSVGVAFNQKREMFRTPGEWVAGIDFSFTKDGKIITPDKKELTVDEFNQKYFVPPIPPSMSYEEKVKEENEQRKAVRNGDGQAKYLNTKTRV